MRVTRHTSRSTDKEDGDAGPIAPVHQLELGHRELQLVRIEPQAEGADQGQRQQPVQRDGGQGVAVREVVRMGTQCGK